MGTITVYYNDEINISFKRDVNLDGGGNMIELCTYYSTKFKKIFWDIVLVDDQALWLFFTEYCIFLF